MAGEFVPRLNQNGIRGNPYWYSNNPYYTSGYGLPNCTCYAWGRFWEEAGPEYRPNLSLRDAKRWYEEDDGYSRSRRAQLGAVACWTNPRFGHVAIVEEINLNNITISESIDGGAYFRINTIDLNGDYPNSDYTFQGFIINPHTGGTPSGGNRKIWYYKKKLWRKDNNEYL